MLVLTRKPMNHKVGRDESEVRIQHAGETIVVAVEQLRSNSVRLSFDGPPSFEITRGDARSRGPSPDPMGA